jgi:hypothetical protein
MASPFGCLNQALISLADTGPESQWNFIKQAYDYGLWYFDELVAKPERPPTTEIAEQMAQFEYKPLPLAQRAGNAAAPLAALVVMNMLLLVVAVIAFNRYDVR